MKIFQIDKEIKKDLIGCEKEGFYQLIKKSQSASKDVEEVVKAIIADVKKNADKALISYCNKFDKTSFSKPSDLLVSEKEIALAVKNLDLGVKKSLELAAKRIEKYHKKQLPRDLTYKDEIGVELGNIWRGIDSVGVYVPGGTASYPSSVLMSVIPAKVAGVKNIVICAPTTAGKINDAVLYAAKICGVKTIYKIGGAQAVAALTYGTKTVAPVNKIVGPGNSFVATAKKILFGEVGIDMIAGPTDITIVADKNVSPKWIAADALSQLEHGTDSKAFVICQSVDFAKQTLAEIKNLAKNLPRKAIIEESLKNSAFFVINKLDNAVHLVNFIAPEHLELAVKNAKKILPKIHNAGAVFLGNFSPESIGDYIAGPSHTLPTSGSAKFSSGLSVYDFIKRISVISCDNKSFAKLAKATEILANCEGLQAHALSVTVRS